jgi:hypothetical protein
MLEEGPSGPDLRTESFPMGDRRSEQFDAVLCTKSCALRLQRMEAYVHKNEVTTPWQQVILCRSHE